MHVEKKNARIESTQRRVVIVKYDLSQNSHKTAVISKVVRRVTLMKCNPVTTGQVYPSRSEHTMTVINPAAVGLKKTNKKLPQRGFFTEVIDVLFLVIILAILKYSCVITMVRFE